MEENNKINNEQENETNKKVEFIQDAIDENNEKEALEPEVQNGEKHSKLIYFIAALLLLIIGCTITILVLNSLSK